MNSGDFYDAFGDAGDVSVPLGEESPVHHSKHDALESAGVNTGNLDLIHAENSPAAYVPAVETTGMPRETNRGHLDKLGVNTGDEHTQWGDSLVDHTGLEPSYNIGPSPMREYTTAMPFPGTKNWPVKSGMDSIFGAVGHRTGPHGQQLAASAHEFFQTAVAPTIQAKARVAASTPTAVGGKTVKGAQMPGSAKLAHAAAAEALPYEIKADAAKARAARAEARLAADVVQARRAQDLATVARQKAEKIGEAAVVVQVAQDKFKAAKKDFSAVLDKVSQHMPLKRVAGKTSTKQRLPGGNKGAKGKAIRQPAAGGSKRQAKLDADVNKDAAENKALATASDVHGLLASVNRNAGAQTDRRSDEKHFSAIAPDASGHVLHVSGKTRDAAKRAASVKQALHSKRPSFHAAVAQRALRHGAQHRGLAFSKNSLCAVTVWGMHPLCSVSA